MNLISLAAFFIRLTGFSFLADATVNLTYLPEYLAMIGSSRLGASQSLHEFEALMIVVRVLLLGLLGLAFLVFAGSLAKLFTRGLPHLTTEGSAQGEIWPPAPKGPPRE